MKRLLSACCILVSLLSCAGKKDAVKTRIIASDKMQEVLWDIFQADVFADKFIKIDSSKNVVAQNAALQQKIFQLHKISREQFYTSYNYYSSQPALMRVLLDSMIAKAERDRNKIIAEHYSGKKVTE